MRSVLFGAMAAGLVLVGASTAEAQESGWWDWALAEVLERSSAGDVPGIWSERDDRRDRRAGDDDRYEDEDRDDRYERGDRRRSEAGRGRAGRGMAGRGRDVRRGGGPPFCRNGRGHPVHGVQWCREKGWAVGADRRDRQWDRRSGLEGVILDRDRGPVLRQSGAELDRRDLLGMLGEEALLRLTRAANLDRRAPLSGRWLEPNDRAGVLQLRSGRMPLAELSDVDGDGRVDAVLFPRR